MFIGEWLVLGGGKVGVERTKGARERNGQLIERTGGWVAYTRSIIES